jgi:hypothetical protein
MKQMKKIVLTHIPPAVEQALMEHLRPFESFEVETAAADLSAADPDLVIAGAPVSLPGCPVLALSFDRPHRLGDLLRQVGQMMAQPVLYIDDIPIGAYLFQPQKRTLARAGGDSIALTDREADMLAYLVRRRGRPVSRDMLLRDVWQYQEGVDTHTLETHIYRLRQKMEDTADAPGLLLTVEGGYTLHFPEASS